MTFEWFNEYQDKRSSRFKHPSDVSMHEQSEWLIDKQTNEHVTMHIMHMSGWIADICTYIIVSNFVLFSFT